jgi:plasmid stabilization system protein ParE
MDDETQNKKITPDPGIFLTKGMKVSIPSFSISIDRNGKLSSNGVTLHTGLDMCPFWLEIAYEHLLKTESAHNELMSAKDEKDSEKIGRSLQKEFVSGMQAIVSSGIAIDSYYASVRDHIDIPESLVKTWRDKGTARYKQIAEVFRRAFSLKQDSARNLRDLLKQNFDFRDIAVHPKYGTTAPMLHVELNKVTDWRYATFRFYNAKAILGLSLSVIYQTAKFGKKRNELKKYCDDLITELEPMLKRWVDKYGKLFSDRII